VGDQIGSHRLEGVGVILLAGHLQQLPGFLESGEQTAHLPDNGVQSGALPVQVLGSFRIIPDIGLLELAGDFL